MVKIDKLSASLEDYLEAIYLFCKKTGKARSKEIMNHLGVSGPSVTEALQILREKGLANYEPYEPISLTPKGEMAARDVLYRHEALRDFFVGVLGIDEKTADEGACSMVHAASPKIIERMVKYTRFLEEQSGEKGISGIDFFKDYIKSQDRQLLNSCGKQHSSDTHKKQS